MFDRWRFEDFEDYGTLEDLFKFCLIGDFFLFGILVDFLLLFGIFSTPEIICFLSFGGFETKSNDSTILFQIPRTFLDFNPFFFPIIPSSFTFIVDALDFHIILGGYSSEYLGPSVDLSLFFFRIIPLSFTFILDALDFHIVLGPLADFDFERASLSTPEFFFFPAFAAHIRFFFIVRVISLGLSTTLLETAFVSSWKAEAVKITHAVNRSESNFMKSIIVKGRNKIMTSYFQKKISHFEYTCKSSVS